ncbi:arginine--tRNA ligase [Selenomonas artemidis]|uniref:Arginine--tRNA ligase n=1 Tax=Selenomonas artemidis F0399 TaxID=749551 RepID=E7N2S1_9FIRM|nr:arginine--tRNA ligase [Selenomonas artemidis]EFW29482.1 arginine--tRNA ligase [Selenomonas artemidis F0399]
MQIKQEIEQAIMTAAERAAAEGLLPQGAALPPIVLEEPPEKDMGDVATNFAMQSARVFRKSPKAIAEIIVSYLTGDWLERTEIAGPGFINLYLKPSVYADMLRGVLVAGEAYGQLPARADAPRVQVEYVSANPTGPLHVGHGRGAAVGSALVKLLCAAGYAVDSEYYVNDAGNQMNLLAVSVNARYLELLGQAVTFPENGYHGADITETARRIIDKDGDKYLALPEEERLRIFQDVAYREKLAALKEDLADFGVTFDRWFSERTLHPDAVRRAVDELLARGTAYRKDGAVWLRSTDYGDDKDRVIFRDNGVPTYLAADIAYHDDKYRRGYGRLINIWGADHHGYVARVKAAMAALGHDPAQLTVLFLQMVSLYRDGDLVKLSKRTGETVTLRELMEEVGVDAARYFFIMRSLDSQLDFDLDLAKKRSNENPAYYVQYAHARISSIFRQAGELGLTPADGAELALLKEDTEIALIKKLAAYPEEIARAAAEYAPQRIARYSYELAGAFHSFYNQCRIVGREKPLASARLALVTATRHVIRHSLGILGVSAPEQM